MLDPGETRAYLRSITVPIFIRFDAVVRECHNGMDHEPLSTAIIALG